MLFSLTSSGRRLERGKLFLDKGTPNFCIYPGEVTPLCTLYPPRLQSSCLLADPFQEKEHSQSRFPLSLSYSTTCQSSANRRCLLMLCFLFSTVVKMCAKRCAQKPLSAWLNCSQRAKELCVPMVDKLLVNPQEMNGNLELMR